MKIICKSSLLGTLDRVVFFGGGGGGGEVGVA